MATRRDDQHRVHDGGADNQDEWQLRAACKGRDATDFFPPAHFERAEVRLARERSAKSICRSCPVTDRCLDHALRTGEPHGVWGGLNEFERRHLLQSDRGR